MRAFLRCLSDYRALWRFWIAPLALIAVVSPLVFTLPLIEKSLIDNVLLARRLDLLPSTVALYGGIWLLISLLQAFGSTLRAYLSEQLSLHLRQRLFVHSEALSVAFSHRGHSGRTMALFANDVPALVGFVGTTTLMVFGSVLALLIGAALMFQMSWQLALVVVVVPPVVGGLATVLTRPLRRASRQVQEKSAELSEHLHENLAGMREVVAFGQERFRSLFFASTLSELLRLRMRLTYMDTTIQAGQRVFSLVVNLVLFGFGGYLVVTGQTTLGTLVAMQRVYDQIYRPAMDLANIGSGFQKVMASVDRIYEFLDEKPLVQERADARAPRDLVGEVVFDRVSFAYLPDRPVLHDVSFTVRPGEMVALVGPSGAGKSTLATLTARFYDPTEGRVLLDGEDLRDLTLEGLRRQIGMVFQDTFLFATTIRENIAFGRPGAGEADIVAAARAANAWEFIERLPGGLNTQVGQRGVQLSEGQKQRLAIARAFLHDPRILILDEPTSALDARSEHLLQSALDDLMRGRTTFVIAHRLATVLHADRILVLDGGRVVEQGTHVELLHRAGLYRELFELQFGVREPLADVAGAASTTLLASS